MMLWRIRTTILRTKKETLNVHSPADLMKRRALMGLRAEGMEYREGVVRRAVTEVVVLRRGKLE
jgi:hypothetical protein